MKNMLGIIESQIYGSAIPWQIMGEMNCTPIISNERVSEREKKRARDRETETEMERLRLLAFNILNCLQYICSLSLFILWALGTCPERKWVDEEGSGSLSHKLPETHSDSVHFSLFSSLTVSFSE